MKNSADLGGCYPQNIDGTLARIADMTKIRSCQNEIIRIIRGKGLNYFKQNCPIYSGLGAEWQKNLSKENRYI